MLHVVLAIIGLTHAVVAVELRPVEVLIPQELREDQNLITIAKSMDQGYGKAFGGVSRDGEGKIILFIGGQEVVYDDRRAKSFEETLQDPDMKDCFSLIYPLTNPTDKVPKNFDPGRIRVEKMFKALYGANEQEVAENCVTVIFCGHRVRFSARCGAAPALESVGKELDEVFRTRPDLKEYVAELGGTFNWRIIAGTERLSNQSVADAIDLNVKKSAYWRWASPTSLDGFTRMDWPVLIIEAFERHGFIWGGKWWHYDTMHFEYRPELIAYSRMKK